MSPLQQDSEQRIKEYQQERDQSKEQGKAAKARNWAKALEEERKILEMIKRVELLNTTYLR